MSQKLRFTFLGTGTSQGVPVIACSCEVCSSEDSLDKRLRSSVLIESETTSIIIDAGPDFRQQLLRANVQKLDAVLITHTHKDHIAGLDDVRAFNYKQKKPMDIYATEASWKELYREFSYIFQNLDYPGLPKVNEHRITADSSFKIGDIEITPIQVWHHKMPVLGFRINDLTYITDANRIDGEELAKAKGSEIFILNSLRREEHISHFTLKQAKSIAEEIGAEQTYFTHISHLLGSHADVSEELPSSMALAHDGLKFTF